MSLFRGCVMSCALDCLQSQSCQAKVLKDYDSLYTTQKVHFILEGRGGRAEVGFISVCQQPDRFRR